MPTPKAERLLNLTRKLDRADLESYTPDEAVQARTQLASIKDTLGTIEESRPKYIHAKGRQLIGPDGQPIALRGFRVAFRESVKRGPIPLAELERYRDQGILGNAQGVEIWWSRDGRESPSEGRSDRPGEYSEAGLERLLESMRNIALAGSWIIPSFRVSYDEAVSGPATANGTQTWQGWADHRSVILDRPVVCRGKQYGTHRARFFAWLDWMIPKLLADPVIAPAIAYWEMWHYPGHKHSIGGERAMDVYFGEFIPALIAKFREHDPVRMLGVPLVADIAVQSVIPLIEAGEWEPYPDPNLCYVIGGYGLLGVIMRPDLKVKSARFPEDSKNPQWDAARGEFNIQTFAKLTGVALHQQEGPGLREMFRVTPIPALQRRWVTGLLDLYDAECSGWGWHAYPPDWSGEPNKTPQFDQTDLFAIWRASFARPPA